MANGRRWERPLFTINCKVLIEIFGDFRWRNNGMLRLGWINTLWAGNTLCAALSHFERSVRKELSSERFSLTRLMIATCCGRIIKFYG